MTTTASSEAAAVDEIPSYPTPRDPRYPLLPPPELRAIHEKGLRISRVKTFGGEAPWLVSSYALQREIMQDRRLSADDRRPGFPQLTEANHEQTTERPLTMPIADGDAHARLRRMLTNSFTRNRMEAIRPKIQAVADKLTDDMLAGPKPVDLVDAFALPLPSLMICDLLGLPYSEHPFFHKYSAVVNARIKSVEQQAEAMSVLAAYMSERIREKMKRPGEDVLTDLANKVQSGELDIEDAGRLGRILLVAGHDTSANMIALGMAALLEHPEQAALIRDTDDPRVIMFAVEELLRYLTISHLLQRRVAIEDMEIDGQLVKAGDGLISSLPSANYDPVAFPDPEKLDVTRDARHHLTFGWGPHQCIGQQLARVELQVVYPTLLRRIPTLRATKDISELSYKADSLAYGLYEFPVTW